MNAPARLPTRSSTRPPTRSWRATWRLLIDSAAPHAHALRRSLLMLAAAAVLQGLALALMLPIFSALLPAAQGRMAGAQALAAALPWLLGFGALALAALALRWRAQWFDYGGQQADAVHRLRSLAGEQLRRMPLLQLQQKRAGEMGAALLGNVDEGLNYTITIATLITQSALTPLAAALGVLAWPCCWCFRR